MSIHHLAPRQVARPAQRQAEVIRIPPPLRGIDTSAALNAGQPAAATYLRNLVPTESGCELRQGYREWQKGVETAPNLGIRTLIPFNSVTNLDVNDRLFAVTPEGIWDVTAASGTPVQKFSFTTTSGGAGFGTYTQYANNNGEDQLFYADMENGLFSYDLDTDTWAQATGITGIAATDVSYVATHKQRLWLAQRDSTVGWYLPIGSVSGEATPFYFGPKFNRGGQLAGFAKWSVDTGAGLDEMFVVVSRAGTVLVYQGADPSTADTWAIRGSYEIGDLPAGVHFMTEHAGDVYLLSSFGVATVNDLLSGVTLRGDDAGEVIGRIADLLRDAMNRTREDFGWGITSIPDEGLLVIHTPVGSFTSAPTELLQFVFSYITKAWGVWQNVPVQACSHWRGRVVVGDPDARILYMDTALDNVLIDPADPNIQNGTAINFSVLTSFTALKADSIYKKVHHIRPDFNLQNPVTVRADAVYDFDILSAALPDTVAGGALDPAIWDQSLWGLGAWSGAERRGSSSLHGDFGTGRYVAIATSGQGTPPLLLLGWDVVYQQGGVL